MKKYILRILALGLTAGITLSILSANVVALSVFGLVSGALMVNEA